MKRIFIILAAIGLCQSAMFGQKKYEMVVEKTDGTEVVFNVEDIVRTYFRERENGGSGENTEENWMVGEWQECNSQGVLYDDATGTEVMHMRLYSDNKGDWWSVTKGKVDDHRFSFTYSYTYDGNSYMVTQTITSSSRPYEVGMSQTTAVTYENGMFHGGEVYYKKIGGVDGGIGGGNGDNTGGNETAYKSCPDDNHPHMIDLGLPSGTKWACCNVGASKPEDYGNYYAWGETQAKEVYNWETYSHCEGTRETCHNIGSDIAGMEEYDAATANWKAPWRMPTAEQYKELVNNCTSEWTTQNNAQGRKFTGSNGGSIFLPAAGNHWGSDFDSAKSRGWCWSSTPWDEDTAYCLNFLSGYASWNSGSLRGCGLSVRPVR